MGEFDHIVAALKASPIASALAKMTESGDFSGLESDAKRHHYVPQFLLKGFADERHEGRRIFQMATSGRKAPTRVGVRNAAVRTHLYTATDENGEASNRHEGYLALVESHAAPALRRLIADPKALTPGDRATIAFFIAFQTTRTPAAAKQITAVANMAFQNMASVIYSDRRAFAERHRENLGENPSAETVEALRIELLEAVRQGKVRVSGKGGAEFGSGLRHAAEHVPMIVGFDWLLVHAPGGGFITSDRGYAIHDPSPPFPWVAQGILSSEASETLVPLSDSAALLIRPGAAQCNLDVVEASEHDVERLNLRTFGWADEYVFAKSQATLDALRVAARRRPADVVRPKPLCAVIGLELDPDDSSLSEENVRRGWPAYLPGSDGEPRDYIVIPIDEPHSELRRRADELAESRARKRLGIGPAEPFDGQIVHRAINPAYLARQ